MTQWYCYVGDKQYGPVDEDTLRGWILHGRVAPADMVWSEGMAAWTPAQQALVNFPSVPPRPGSSSAQGQPLPPGVEPHRGVAVLILGLVGLAGVAGCLGIFLGIAAWAMGSADLRKMNEGRMDPSGRGMTQAGRILGIIEVGLGLLMSLVYVAIFVGMGAASSME